MTKLLTKTYTLLVLVSFALSGCNPFSLIRTSVPVDVIEDISCAYQPETGELKFSFTPWGSFWDIYDYKLRQKTYQNKKKIYLTLLQKHFGDPKRFQKNLNKNISLIKTQKGTRFVVTLKIAEFDPKSDSLIYLYDGIEHPISIETYK